MGRVQGKVALVTGGAAGLGEAAALMLAREGAVVIVTDIDAAGGARVAARITAETGGIAVFQRHDVTSEAEWEAAMALAVERFGRLDILVNNAGISEPGTIEDETLAHWQRTMAINADSVFLGCKHGVRTMKATGGGSIINISSALGIKAGATYAAYCASKAAVRHLTKSVALHCGERRYNIRCNSIHPGAIRTPMFERYVGSGPDRDRLIQAFADQHPLGHVGEADDIAYAVLYLASDEARFVTGEELCVDGGLVL